MGKRGEGGLLWHTVGMAMGMHPCPRRVGSHPCTKAIIPNLLPAAPHVPSHHGPGCVVDSVFYSYVNLN